jgi:putative sugar O-methyltransferase
MEKYSSLSFLEKKMNFAKGFPAYRSENSLSLDKKHEQIIGALESSEDWLTSFQESDIRYWSMQDDIGQTPYWMDYLNRDGSKFVNLAKFILHKTKNRKENKMVFDSIVDDISMIRHLYGESYLKDNPVDQTPGNPKYSKIHNFKVNSRWMRYIYLANTIKAKDLLPSGGVWVDIGSYYGGLQGVVFKYNQSSKVILVDFHHQLFRSYAYLSEVFPNVKHNLGINETLEDESKGSFNYVHVSDFFALKSLNIDLLTNFFSFGEMQRDVFKNYIDSEVAAKSSTIYTVNRFVSAPFFEKTYDNDLSVLDYQFSSHRLSYFDVFPIHHFAEFSREFFGVTRPRNTSSSYFESIFKRN